MTPMHRKIGSTMNRAMLVTYSASGNYLRPMLTYCQLYTQKQTPMEYELKYMTFHSRKCIFKAGDHFIKASMQLLFEANVHF